MAKNAVKKKEGTKMKSKSSNKPVSKKAGPSKSATSKAPKVTIATVAKEAILAGKSTEAVIAHVVKKFPDSKISASAVGWYRGQLKADGHKLKEQTRGPKKGSVAKAKKSDKAAKSEEGEGGF